MKTELELELENVSPANYIDRTIEFKKKLKNRNTVIRNKKYIQKMRWNNLKTFHFCCANCGIYISELNEYQQLEFHHIKQELRSKEYLEKVYGSLRRNLEIRRHPERFILLCNYCHDMIPQIRRNSSQKKINEYFCFIDTRVREIVLRHQNSTYKLNAINYIDSIMKKQGVLIDLLLNHTSK